MEKASNKSERLSQFVQLLLANPYGLRRAEIARRLQVNKSTITRYVNELSRGDVAIPIYEEDDGRININRERFLNYIALTLNEIMAVHISTRLMAAIMDKHNPYAASAVLKLGQALETFAPTVSRHLRISANVMDDVAQRYDPNFLRVLEILTRAWSEGRLVHIWHKSRKWDRVFEYDFAPYFIEPYAVGHSIYVIGWRPDKNVLRTYKIERIERAELLDETYTIPTDFDPTDKLADAWGIWYTDADPVEVVLRFHPRVADRVEETRWHRNEQTTRQPDGYLLWRTWVAEPKEMLNWVRGWGADVEIVEPEYLRLDFIREIRRLSKIYGLTEQTLLNENQPDYHQKRANQLFRRKQ